MSLNLRRKSDHATRQLGNFLKHLVEEFQLFSPSSGLKYDRSGAFRPGRARLATIPFPTASPVAAITIGIVLLECFGGSSRAPTPVTITSKLKTNQLGSKLVEIVFKVSVLNRDIFSPR